MTGKTTPAATLAATLLLALTGCTDSAVEETAPVDEAAPPDAGPADVVEEEPVAAPEPQPVAAEPEDAVPAAELEPTKTDIALAKQISFNFQGATARAVFDYISQVSGTNVVIDPQVAETLDGVPVTMKLTDVSTLAALKTIARVVGAKVEVEDELVMIVSQ